jgi:predicted dehydrogenase
MARRNRHRDGATRREFLGTMGAALLGATAGMAFPAQREVEMERRRTKEKVRLAVVGGGFGATHHWHEHPNCVVTGVTDLVEDRRQRLVQQYGCDAVYPSLEEMLEKAPDTFDAVAIFTDAPSHVKHVTWCMEQGKHVVSACPAALTLDDCRKLKELKEKTGLVYMMHESSYYRQPCIAARELYEAGKFGKLCYMEAEYYHPGIGTKSDTLSRWQGLKSWRYGYPPMLYPTHSLGLTVGVTKERVVKVSCLGQLVGGDFPAGEENVYNNPFDNEMALAITDKGNMWRFGVFWMVAAHGERGQWLGEKMSCYMEGSGGQPQAMMKMDEGWQAWDVPQFWKTERLPEPMRHDSGHGGSSAFLSAEFIDAIVEEREPTVDIYESIAMTAPGIVAHQSALKGGVQLDVPQFEKAGI